MAIPAVGDGLQIGDGNVNETLCVASLPTTSTRKVQIAASTGYVGFYGITPVVRRPFTASVHNTTAIASSTDFGATQLAVVQEIMKTLIGLGIYATS